MKKALVLALSLAMFCAACSTAWVVTLDSILAAAAPALINILQIVAVANGSAVDATLTSKITVDAAAIKKLAGDFAAASGGSASGVCQELQGAVRAYQGDQELVLQIAQVRDANTQAKIMLLVNLVAGTVDAITAVIPPCQKGLASPVSKAALPSRAATFADDYNGILVVPTGNGAVDGATAKLKLRRHSKFVRVISLGKIQ